MRCHFLKQNFTSKKLDHCAACDSHMAGLGYMRCCFGAPSPMPLKCMPALLNAAWPMSAEKPLPSEGPQQYPQGQAPQQGQQQGGGQQPRALAASLHCRGWPRADGSTVHKEVGG
mmetsp:Transcript_10387/g.31535  ORF Transcript_10387/g.31535 Transcript_10387/m.31535 type:complete len:115 (+) Transcript_10387:568-912(+)